MIRCKGQALRIFHSYRSLYITRGFVKFCYSDKDNKQGVRLFHLAMISLLVWYVNQNLLNHGVFTWRSKLEHHVLNNKVSITNKCLFPIFIGEPESNHQWNRTQLSTLALLIFQCALQSIPPNTGVLSKIAPTCSTWRNVQPQFETRDFSMFKSEASEAILFKRIQQLNTISFQPI